MRPRWLSASSQHQRHPPRARRPARPGRRRSRRRRAPPSGRSSPDQLAARAERASSSTAAARAARSGCAAVSGCTSQRAQLVAGRRHQLELGPLAADEHDLGALSSQRVGDRERRHDVPGGPAGADHEPSERHARSLDCLQPSRPRSGDVEQQPDRGEHHAQVRRRIGDERQRHAGQRREPEHDEDVQQSLAQNQRGQAGRQQLRIAARRPARGAQPGVGDHPVEEHDRRRSRARRAPRRSPRG